MARSVERLSQPQGVSQRIHSPWTPAGQGGGDAFVQPVCSAAGETRQAIERSGDSNEPAASMFHALVIPPATRRKEDLSGAGALDHHRRDQQVVTEQELVVDSAGSGIVPDPRQWPDDWLAGGGGVSCQGEDALAVFGMKNGCVPAQPGVLGVKDAPRSGRELLHRQQGRQLSVADEQLAIQAAGAAIEVQVFAAAHHVRATERIADQALGQNVGDAPGDPIELTSQLWVLSRRRWTRA